MPRILLCTLLVATGCDGRTASSPRLGDAGAAFLPLGDAGTPLLRPLHVFRLVGTVANQEIDISDTRAGIGWSREVPGTSSFDTQFVLASIDPTRTRLSLSWTDDLQHDTYEASGTFVMASNGSSPGQSYCTGGGTQVHFSAQVTAIEIAVRGLSVGPDCSQTVPGSLVGCYVFDDHPP
jgi:hypothetical protein